MTQRFLEYDGFHIAVAPGWEDITATLDDADAPLTLADPIAGVGALQLSPAIFRGGRPPRIGPSDLRSLLDEFASRHGMQSPFDRTSLKGEVIIEGASYRSGEDLIRAWYASDRSSVMFATYVCAWADRHLEDMQRELSVQSIRFSA